MYYLYAPVGGYARSLSYAKIFAKNFVMNLPLLEPSPWGEGVCDSRRMRGSYINETQNISL